MSSRATSSRTYPPKRTWRRFVGRLALAGAGLLFGILVAVRWLGPSLLAAPLARWLEFSITEKIQGEVLIRNVELGAADGSLVKAEGVRLRDARGATLLEGTLRLLRSPTGEAEYHLGDVGGRLELRPNGSLDLFEALGPSAEPAEMGTLSLDLGGSRVLVQLGERGVEITDPSRGTRGTRIVGGELDLHLRDARSLDAAKLDLRASEGFERLAVEWRASEGAAPVQPFGTGTLDCEGASGAWLDAWSSAQGRIRSWIEDRARIQVEVGEPDGGASPVLVRVAEPKGTTLQAGGSLDGEVLQLGVSPRAARISASSELLLGGVASVFDPELRISSGEELVGTLRTGLVTIPLGEGVPKVEFNLVPSRFPQAELFGLGLALDPNLVRYEYAQGRQVADVGGRLAGRGPFFSLRFLGEGDGVPPSARGTVSDCEVGLVEDWVGFPGLLGSLLGPRVSVTLRRDEPDVPLGASVVGPRGFLGLRFDGDRVARLAGEAASFQVSVGELLRSGWLARVLPWLDPAEAQRDDPVTLTIEQLGVAAPGAPEQRSWTLLLDLGETELLCRGPFDSLLDPALERRATLAEPVRLELREGRVLLEGVRVAVGAHEVVLTGSTALDGSDTDLRLAVPTGVVRGELVGLGDLPLERLLAGNSVNVQARGSVAAPTLSTDLGALQKLRSLLESVLNFGG